MNHSSLYFSKVKAIMSSTTQVLELCVLVTLQPEWDPLLLTLEARQANNYTDTSIWGSDTEQQKRALVFMCLPTFFPSFWNAQPWDCYVLWIIHTGAYALMIITDVHSVSYIFNSDGSFQIPKALFLQSMK